MLVLNVHILICHVTLKASSKLTKEWNMQNAPSKFERNWTKSTISFCSYIYYSVPSSFALAVLTTCIQFKPQEALKTGITWFFEKVLQTKPLISPGFIGNIYKKHHPISLTRINITVFKCLPSRKVKYIYIYVQLRTFQLWGSNVHKNYSNKVITCIYLWNWTKHNVCSV